MFKMKLFRFTKTVHVMDLRTDAITQRIAEIKRKAARYEVLNHTRDGYSSAFRFANPALFA